MFKRSLPIGLVGIFVFSSIALTLLSSSQAAAASSYNLISENVYLNKKSMTQAQIQSFLEGKKSALATYKDQGPNETKKELASYLIWHAAQIWGINPQVILATLQKEQSLVTKQNPTSIDYRSAMGYGCPDGKDCNASYYGFANQVNMASYQFRYNYEVLNGKTSFNDGDGDPHGVGSYACNQPDSGHTPPFYNVALRPGNTVTFSRNTAVSGTQNRTVTIANKSTSSLLCYTPHVGPYATTGYSGSDNFTLYFTQWFGSTTYSLGGAIGNKYASTGGENGPLGQVESNEKVLASGATYQQFENGRIYWKSHMGAWVVAGGIGDKYISINGATAGLGSPLNDEVYPSTGGAYQQFENGRIYWKSKKGTWVVSGGIGDKYIDGGADSSDLGYPLSDETLISSGAVYQQFENGRIYWKSHKGVWVVKGDLLTYYLSKNSADGYIGSPTSDAATSGSITYQSFENVVLYKSGEDIFTTAGSVGNTYLSNGGAAGELGGPMSNELVLPSGGVYQQFKNGRIYWKSKKGAWIVDGKILTKYTADSASEGYIGYPIDKSTVQDNVTYQAFENATIYTTDDTSFVTHGSVRNKHLALGGISGSLGAPIGNEVILSTGGVYQQFENGRIYWKSKKGTWVVAGGIGDKYISAGASNALGSPLSDEVVLSSGGVYQQYENARIYWKSHKGAWLITSGSIGKTYISDGADNSWVGYPLSDEIPLSTGGVYQQFENGRIYWKSKKGTWVVAGGIGDKYIAQGADKSPLGYPLSNELPLKDGKTYQKYEHGTITWTPRVGASIDLY